MKADEAYPGDSGCNFAVEVDVLLQNLEPNGNDGSEAIRGGQLSLRARRIRLRARTLDLPMYSFA